MSNEQTFSLISGEADELFGRLDSVPPPLPKPVSGASKVETFALYARREEPCRTVVAALDTVRLQQNLEDYLRHRWPNKTPWQVGRDFERYVGFRYEERGYKVTYNGITEHEEDYGVDLFCVSEARVLAVQCKNWKDPVMWREVAMIAGASLAAARSAGWLSAIPVLLTTGPLPTETIQYANRANVVVRRVVPREYPVIKCKRSSNYFHLPWHSNYDRTKLISDQGDRRVFRVEEAVLDGFVPAQG